MHCDKLEWKTGPVPDQMKHILVVNKYGEYEVGVNVGGSKTKYYCVSGDLYRKVTTYLADWNGIYSLDEVVVWAELPHPKSFSD